MRYRNVRQEGRFSIAGIKVELFLSLIAASKETIAPAEQRLKGWILPVYTNKLGASFSY